MAENQAFADAQIRVKNLNKTPSAQELLKLYALYKQANVGDANGPRPSVFEVRARAKYDAWVKEQGTAAETAAEQYVTLVTELQEKYNH